MAPSPCESVQAQLSAFVDDELQAAERQRIAEHLAQCPGCQAQLARFRQIGHHFRETSSTDVPNQWPSIEARLRAPQSMIGPWWSRKAGIAAAVAASLLIAVGFWMSSTYQGATGLTAHTDMNHEDAATMAVMEMDAAHMREFQQVMDEYLVKLSVDPGQAEAFLLSKYDGQRVAPDQAESLVGYRPLISRGLPAGYELASSSVVNMPCCTCFKAVCRRSDGSTLVLFEHDDEQDGWFGNRKTNMATCGDKECCLVELGANIAATWQEGSRSITAVGARDKGEVTMLVNAIKEL